MFTKRMLEAIDDAGIVGIRAGAQPHRFVGVWAVVVSGRVFVRSWGGQPGGWYRTLLDERRGVLQVDDKEIRIRAQPARSERIMDAMDAAYREKYPTPGSRKFVRGFARPTRRARSLELLAHAQRGR